MTSRATALAVCLLLAGCGGVIHGRVFVDRDGDRVRDPDEPGIAGARVFFEGCARTRADAAGDYILATPFPLGIAWAWTPDGFRPGPSYAHVLDADGVVDIPVEPFANGAVAPTAAAPWTFAVATDSHVVVPVPGIRLLGDALAPALLQVVAPAPATPAFVTILGDITQGSEAGQFALVDAALARTPVPFVGVTGNHDLAEGGHLWRVRYGPDVYGFDLGGLRFLVWNGFVDDAVQLELVHLALDGEDPAARIVGLGHASPRDVVARAMAALGVDYLFTGHWHANRRIDRFGLTEWGTEPLTMGGLDHSPAGYRVVSVDAGRVATEARRTLLQPVLALASPTACAGPGRVDVIAIAALDAGTPAVTAAWAGTAPVALAPAGGWAYTGALAPPGSAPRELVLTATAPGGAHAEARVTLAPCTLPPAWPARTGAWSQLQGGPAHTGSSPARVADLAPAWTTTVGGEVLGGSPIVDGDTVYVTATDPGDGDRGGVVALALATGAERWRFRTPHPARSTVAVAHGIVVVPDSDGTVYGVDAATGRERWHRDLAAGTDSWSWHIWQPPTIVGDTVYVGTQLRIAALDLATGEPRWTHELPWPLPWLGSSAAATLSGAETVFVGNREQGLWIGDAATGAERIALLSLDFIGIAGAPVADAGRLYIGNSMGTVLALDPATLGVHWKAALVPGGFDWSESIVAGLAVAGGRVFAATQAGEVVGLDAATGAVAWRTAIPPGPLAIVHYATDGTGVIASPVVTGDVVWIGGPDGHLRGLDAATGAVREDHAVGAPILAGVAPVDGGVVVATVAGTVQLLARSRPPAPGGTGWPVVPVVLIALALAAAITASWRTLRSRRDRAARRT